MIQPGTPLPWKVLKRPYDGLVMLFNEEYESLSVCNFTDYAHMPALQNANYTATACNLFPELAAALQEAFDYCELCNGFGLHDRCARCQTFQKLLQNVGV